MTDQDLFGLLTPEDRREVAAPCFQDGRFDAAGDLDCKGYERWAHPDCRKELLCELMAALLLTPRYSGQAVDEAAVLFGVDPWVIRFNQAIDQCYKR